MHQHAGRIDEVQVRGTTATATVTFGEGMDVGFAVLVWEEAPGVHVRLRYGASEDPLNDAISFAEELVAVDDEGWTAFSDAHDGDVVDYSD